MKFVWCLEFAMNSNHQELLFSIFWLLFLLPDTYATGICFVFVQVRLQSLHLELLHFAFYLVFEI